ncbi:MAG: PepSY-associated TM helix domain-containing protein [Arenimonas sp.]
MQTTDSARRTGRTYRVFRQVHLWVGAWGAIAAILFGFTGLVMNHRFVWNLPQGENVPAEPTRVGVPDAARTSPEALAAWLQREHGLATLSRRVQPGKEKVPLGAGQAAQPEKWTLGGGSARDAWSAEYAAGDASLEIKRTSHGWLSALNRLHKSQGGGIAWIVLGDSFALAIVFLGLTGLVLWGRGRTPKQRVVSVFALAVLVVVVVLGPALA